MGEWINFATHNNGDGKLMIKIISMTEPVVYRGGSNRVKRTPP